MATTPANVPQPTAAQSSGNYYIGQTINYGGQAYTPLYDQSGKRIGYRNQAGAMIDPTPVLDGLSPPTITPTGAVSAAQAAAANQPSGSTASSFGINPTITYGGAQTGPTQGEQPPDINYARAYLRQAGGRPLTDTSFDQGVSDAQVMDFWNKQHPAPAQAPTPAGPTIQPEQVGLSNLAQIDPTSEALRQNLGQSYLNTLNQAPMPTFAGGQAPAAGDIQSYLDLYKQIDPAGYAQRQALGQNVSDYTASALGQAQANGQISQLGTAMGSYLTEAQQQAALGSQLDPQTIRELEQSTRMGQAARGNVYGTPQLVAEAMTRGQAGMAIQQQREAALGTAAGAMQNYQQGALGLQQGYLSSGQSLGDIANTLYQQGYARNLASYQTQLGAQQSAQSGALGYLGSGQTPYQAGAAYVDRAQQAAADAAQGGATYNPSQIGQSYQAAQLPQYGLDIGAQATNWYNSMVSQSANQAAYSQPKSGGTGSALGGAASGALSGATAGSALGPWGTAIGAVGGAVAGGLKGYYS
jgi:hypothetical protein